jgi:hypothetical protein
MIWMLTPLSSISSDPLSPHYGHQVATQDEGQWVCVSCDPDVVDVECRACGEMYVAECDVNETCPWCDNPNDEEVPL